MLLLACPDDDAGALGAVAGPPLRGDQQHEHVPTGQLGDVAAGVGRGAAGGLAVRVLQGGSVRQRAGAGRPGHARRAVLTAHRCTHFQGRAGGWRRRGFEGGRAREEEQVRCDG